MIMKNRYLRVSPLVLVVAVLVGCSASEHSMSSASIEETNGIIMGDSVVPQHDFMNPAEKKATVKKEASKL